MSDQLLLFTRFPEPGQVKTRLISTLGRQGAADLHTQLTEHCVKQIQPSRSEPALTLQIIYTGGSKKQMKKWFPHIPILEQKGKNLGERIVKALSQARAKGGQRLLLFGADCPDLNKTLIHQALTLLETRDLALGPTFDGGFYLLGIASSYPTDKLESLLNDISWGTAKVWQQTITKADNADFSHGILPTLHDIDRPEDLEHFYHHTRP